MATVLGSPLVISAASIVIKKAFEVLARLLLVVQGGGGAGWQWPVRAHGGHVLTRGLTPPTPG